MRLLTNCLIAAIVLCLTAFAAGCDEKEDNSLLSLLPVVASSQCSDITLPAGATLIRKGSVFIRPQHYCYYLLELQYDDHDPSYAMWIPPVSGGVRPAVLMTRPYDYISWNGDDIPRGTEMSVREYVEGSVLFMLNNFGVLNVFERYYTGGSIQNDVDDTVAGYRFLNDSAGLVDKTRIGTWGGSWGGFEALYGAAYSFDSGGMVPAAGVAFYPLSDFQDEVDYIENSAGESVLPNNIPDITAAANRTDYQDFFAPYLTRIKATSEWESWTGSNLVLKLATPFVVVHDEWDTLVPFEQSVYLVNNDDPDGLITPLFFYQNAPRDLNDRPWGWGHGELREYALDETPPPAAGVVYGISNTLASAYLFTRIATADQTQLIIGYDAAALGDFMTYIRDQKCNTAHDIAWAASLLRDCADDRMMMVDMSDFSFDVGAEVIAGAFSSAGWGGTSYGTAANVYTALDGGLPDCTP